MDPADLGATELTALFAKGSLSPVEVLDAVLARCERVNRRAQCDRYLDPDGRAAGGARERRRAGARARRSVRSTACR